MSGRGEKSQPRCKNHVMTIYLTYAIDNLDKPPLYSHHKMFSQYVGVHNLIGTTLYVNGHHLVWGDMGEQIGQFNDVKRQ